MWILKLLKICDGILSPDSKGTLQDSFSVVWYISLDPMRLIFHNIHLILTNRLWLVLNVMLHNSGGCLAMVGHPMLEFK